MNEEHLYDGVKRQWNVFICQGLLDKPPGFLTGYIDRDARQLYILGLATRQNCDEFERGSNIGYWHGKNIQSFERQVRSRAESSLRRDDKCVLHLVNVKGKLSLNFCENGTRREEEPPVCIVFEPSAILKSYLLSSQYCHVNNVINSMSPIKDFCGRDDRTVPTASDVLGERLSQALDHFQYDIRLPGEKLFFKKHNPALHTQLLKDATWILPSIVVTLLSFLHFIFNSSSLTLKNVLCVPSFSKHLLERCRRSHSILKLDQKQPFHKLILYNIYSQQIFESMIGVYVLYFVISYNIADNLATSILDWADNVASHSNDLIKWLMGAPAGLKLNSQLTSMLGHFFIYHIYLWTGYLNVLRTALPWLLKFASWTGVIGISFQLCMVKDVVSMLTLHIYCFYVYAARIFNLQVSALSSMWRLFRGKKWNTLRSRVDSAAYNTDQLFVGTLLFTVLLFLLPTTALYYAVFTGLRMVTLTVQAVLTHIIKMISLTPVYSLLLRLVRPKWIAGRVEFDLVWLSKPPANLVLAMKTSCLSVSELIKLTAPYLYKSRSPMYSWSHFLSCVASGKILYPWMGDINDDLVGEKDGKTKAD